MNLYQAITTAARHIEHNPKDLNFNSTCIPECGTPGCVLGWIGAFFGMEPKAYGFSSVADEVLKLAPEPILPTSLYSSSAFTFYHRMDALCENRDWRSDAVHCASTLRLYAQKYHGSENQQHNGIPAEIRAIFERTYTAEDLSI